VVIGFFYVAVGSLKTGVGSRTTQRGEFVQRGETSDVSFSIVLKEEHNMSCWGGQVIMALVAILFITSLSRAYYDMPLTSNSIQHVNSNAIDEDMTLYRYSVDAIERVMKNSTQVAAHLQT